MRLSYFWSLLRENLAPARRLSRKHPEHGSRESVCTPALCDYISGKGSTGMQEDLLPAIPTITSASIHTFPLIIQRRYSGRNHTRKFHGAMGSQNAYSLSHSLALKILFWITNVPYSTVPKRFWMPMLHLGEKWYTHSVCDSPRPETQTPRV